MPLWMRIAVAVLLVVAIAFGSNELASRFAPEPQKPIIAQIFAAPNEYVGRRIEIYGLVIEGGANTFLLQDVSQRPLKVRGQAETGDQLTVTGTLRSETGSLVVEADSLRMTKVLAGGGCC